jgi:hypothetical protein
MKIRNNLVLKRYIFVYLLEFFVAKFSTLFMSNVYGQYGYLFVEISVICYMIALFVCLYPEFRQIHIRLVLKVCFHFKVTKI